MKKLAIVAVAMTLITGMGFASSIAIPWFVDFAPHEPGTGLPPASGVASVVFLKNNTGEAITARIEYFTATGNAIGPNSHEAGGPGNSFSIAALASVAARLGGTDTTSEASPGGADIPNRPLGTGGGNDGKKNGSARITWIGDAGDIQGAIQAWDASGRSSAGVAAVFGYAHLLPAGN
jgi:hypothetical protein